MSVVISSLLYLKTLGFISGVGSLKKLHSDLSYRLSSDLENMRMSFPIDLRTFLELHQERITALISSSKRLDDDDHSILLPINYKGNSVVWQVYSEIEPLAVPKDHSLNVMSVISRSHTISKEISSIRSAHHAPKHISGFLEDVSSNETPVTYFNKMNGWCELLYNIETRANKEFESFLNRFKTDKTAILKWIKVGYMRAVSLWGNVFLCIKNEGKKIIHFFTNVHFRRLTDMVRVTANLSLAFGTLNLPEGSVYSLRRCFKIMIKFSKIDPDSVGEWVKAARNILVCEFDTDDLMGVPMSKLMMKEFDDLKKDKATVFLDLIKELTGIKEERMMISNVYKAIPHPDLDMREAFEKIKGILSPNKVEKQGLSMFKGVLRKSIYMSLKEQGHDVRCEEIKVDHSLEDMINGTQVNTSILRSTHAIRWSQVKFTKVLTLPDFLDLSVPVGDKSSATSAIINESDFKTFVNNSKHNLRGDYEKTEKAKKLRPVNDILSSLKEQSELDPKPAWKKFVKIYNINEHFEARYPSLDVEEIPHADLVDTIREHYEIAYNIQTEPKLGEKHKKITRMFYMAEQSLKTITQRVERIAKNISRKQSGVSIVKDYSARRKDLEAFASSMKSSPRGLKNIYISFDLNSFSMKFPMVLLREYGNLLAEITGYKELKRIDLFFRFTKVIHSTRGFFDIMYGPLGGFEGFLNFVWSSIHATVMEIALNDIGKTGYLLTYSDDGLLQIQVPENMSRDKVRYMIHKINTTYESYGLIFNIGKTIISGEVWEYLGDICYQGHLIPQWMKEISSLSIKEDSEGFNPLINHHDAIIGQCSSLAHKGFPAYLAEYLAVYYNSMELMRIYPKINDLVVKVAMILPRNMGGFRVPPAIKMSIASNISDFSEFIADLAMFKLSNPKLVAVINSMVDEFFPDRNECFNTLMNGSYFKLKTPQVDAKSIIRYLIEKIEDKVNLNIPLEPISDLQRSSMADLFKHVKNLDPLILSEFISAMPDVKLYNDATALVHSKTAFRILGKKQMRNAQAKDRRNCLRAINTIINHTGYSTHENSDPDYLLGRIFKDYLTNYNVRPPRVSARLLLTKDNHIYDFTDYTVSIALLGKYKATINSMSYLEPTAIKKSNKNILSWTSELSISRRESYLKKFLQVMSAIMTHHYEAYDIFLKAASVMGISMPAVPTNTTTAIHRYRSFMSSRPDIMLGAPSSLISKSIVKLSPRLLGMYQSSLSSDRTTYTEIARWMGIQSLLSRDLFRIESSDEPFTYKLNISPRFTTLAPHYLPIEMKKDNKKHLILHQPLETNVVSLQLAEMYNNNVLEYMKTEIFSTSVSAGFGYSENTTELIKMIVSEVITSDISRLVFRSITTPMHFGIVRPNILPSSLASYVSEIDAGYVRCFYKWVKRFPGIKEKVVEFVSSQMMFYPSELHSYMDIFIDLCNSKLNSFPVEIFTHRRLAGVLADTYYVRKVLSTLIRSIFTEEGKKKKLILFDKSTAGMLLATEGRVSLINDELTHLISDIYREGKKYNWDSKKLLSSNINLDISINIDWFLDMCILAKNMTRKSTHRAPDHPYNSTTFIIEFVKYLSLIYSVIGGVTYTKEEFLDYADRFTLYEPVKKKLITELKLEPKDTDHITKIHSNVIKKMHLRAYYMLLAHDENLNAPQSLKEKQYYQPAFSNYDISFWIKFARNQSSSFYQTVISEINRSITVYTSFAHSSLYGELPLFKNARHTSINLNLAESEFTVQEISKPPKELQSILWGQLAMHLFEVGIPSYDFEDDFPNHVTLLAKYNALLKTSTSVGSVKVLYNKFRKKSLSAHIYKLSNEGTAKCLIAALYEFGVSNAYAVTLNSGTYVLFVTKKSFTKKDSNLKIKVVKKATFEFPKMINRDGVLLTTDVANEVILDIEPLVIKSALFSAYKQVDISEEQHKPTDLQFFNTPTDHLLDTKIVGSSGKGLHLSSKIMAASELVKGASDRNSMLAAYCLMISFSKGLNKEDTLECANIISAILTKGNRMAIRSIQADIRATVTWLKLLEGSINSHISEDVLSWLSILNGLKSNVDIENAIILPGMPKKVKDVMYSEFSKANFQISQDDDRWLIEDMLFGKVQFQNFMALSSGQFVITSSQGSAIKFDTINEEYDINEN